MANKMLVQNKGKKGSYTIKVHKDYAVPKKPLVEIIKDFYEAESKIASFCKLKKQATK